MTNDMQKVIALQFNECINNRDIHGLAILMADDHTFIDKANQAVQGKEKVVEAWQGFFALFPDYQNIFERVKERFNLVAISGYSTCPEKQLDGPALWTAKIKSDKVAEWRVYEDTPENRKRLSLE